MKSIKIKELVAYLDKLAPIKLAASSDNTGLLIGIPEDNISKILLSLDVTPKVVDYAIETGTDMIVSHHPLFLSPLKKINDPLIIKMIRNQIALISMHTNLDFVTNGVNQALANILELKDTSFLSELPEITSYLVTVYTPEQAVNVIAEAVFREGAGVIGKYSHCMNKYMVEGQFKPLAGSNPAIGTHNNTESVREIKLEFLTDIVHLDKVIKAMITAHPYETPAYNILQTYQNSRNYGLGIVGQLPEAMTLSDIASMVKERLGAPFVTIWLADKTENTLIKKVAVCGGSGGDLIKAAEEKAELFVSSDFKYHSIIGSRIPLINAGHFFTENPVLASLQKYLKLLNIEVELFKKTEADIYRLKIY